MGGASPPRRVARRAGVGALLQHTSGTGALLLTFGLPCIIHHLSADQGQHRPALHALAHKGRVGAFRVQPVGGNGPGLIGSNTTTSAGAPTDRLP